MIQQVNQHQQQGHESFTVSYQAVTARKDSVFILQDEKGAPFITGHEGQDERPDCKAFEQTQVPPPMKNLFILSDEKKYLLGPDGELTE